MKVSGSADNPEDMSGVKHHETSHRERKVMKERNTSTLYSDVIRSQNLPLTGHFTRLGSFSATNVSTWMRLRGNRADASAKSPACRNITMVGVRCVLPRNRDMPVRIGAGFKGHEVQSRGVVGRGVMSGS